MTNPDRMTTEEIHDFGIEIVSNQLKKEGYEIQSVNTELGKNPQIITKKETQLAFIAVRTACYPEKGST
jgi:methanogenic corrinoid protein MtbC1